MAGGSGERFWPLSRIARPKHLVQLLSETTLLEETVRRVEQSLPSGQIFVLTNAAQIEGCRAVLPQLKAHQFVAEPAKRDTAPACALGTALVRNLDPDAVVVFLPADALIKDAATFAAQLKQASDLIQMDQVFAWTIAQVAMMLVIEIGLLQPLERHLFRWRRDVRS